MDWAAVLWAVLVGALSGALAALIGYAKGTVVEKFSPYKALLTVAIGLAVGAVAGYQGVDVMVPANFGETHEVLLDAGVVGVINWLVLLVWRRSGLAERYGDGGGEEPTDPNSAHI